MSSLRYLCLLAVSGVQHILCFVFAVFFFVLLSVSLDSPFLIAPSVFSNVYLQFLWIVLFLIAPSVFSNVYLQFLWIVYF